jgi:hypothetical protein
MERIIVRKERDCPLQISMNFVVDSLEEMLRKGYSISGSGQAPVMTCCEHGNDIQVLFQAVNCFS